MKSIFTVLIIAACFACAGVLAAEKKAGPRRFVYDKADQIIEAGMLKGNDNYDPSVVSVDGKVWLAWLEFTAGKGDTLWVGKRNGDAWAVKEPVDLKIDVPAPKLAKPTLTVDAAGSLWLTVEALNADEQWDVFLCQRRGAREYTVPQRISIGKANDIHHAVSPDPKEGLWVAWQSDRNGQFDIVARHVGTKASATLEAPIVISDTARNEWHPSISVGHGGKVYIAWDAYDGDVYNVWVRRLVEGTWEAPIAVASGSTFQGRPQVASNGDGQAWIVWEEGAERWGKPHRGMAHRNQKLSDTDGPLHRFRTLHVGLIGSDGVVHNLKTPLPTPSFAQAEKRDDARKNSVKIGVFYERALLLTDTHNRPWILYRHYYCPQTSYAHGMKSHVEAGWKIYARCMEADSWSQLYAFTIGQRDGLQRLSMASTPDGLVAAWATGRTDRRNDAQERGLALATLAHPVGNKPAPKLVRNTAATPKEALRATPPRSATVGGKTYQLFYGDLHRHTDLSLCFPYFDGSLNDAYRYAMDVAELDFLGITDHTRDIHKGDVLSQLWWRCTKEVTRHRLTNKFYPFFSYERSHGATDHNVISLRDDMLRNYPLPLQKFWAEITDGNTFTMPHNPIIGKIWDYHDDALRPLIEVYQGYRDGHILNGANAGLKKGYHLGFIASSDHVSTSASYACVWSEKGGNEPLFRAMQARRTFGATSKIRLVFRSGDHWMGERMTAKVMPVCEIEIDGTAAINVIDFWQDGKLVKTVTPEKASSSYRGSWTPDGELTGEHYVYIHVKQTDGNQAWSSPLWIRRPEDP